MKKRTARLLTILLLGLIFVFAGDTIYDQRVAEKAVDTCGRDNVLGIRTDGLYKARVLCKDGRIIE